LNSVEDVYPKRFFKQRHKLNWRVPHVCNAVADIFGLKKGDAVIDVGCAIGDLVSGFLSMGFRAEGIEGSQGAVPFLVAPPYSIRILDIRLPINIKNFNIPYKLVTCFEVAEHLEPEYADTFVSNLASLSDTIVMSAAPPGQEGHGHVNCRPYEYWIGKFNERGYIYDNQAVYSLRQRWMDWRKKPGIKAFFDNLLVFKR